MTGRRRFIRNTAAAGAALISGSRLRGETPDVNALQAEIEKHHDENVRRIQDWIRQPSIAAENRGMTEGCDMMMRLLRDAGFDTVNKVPTEGHPGVFATLDAGAPRTVGIYFMYDVKQVDPSEWSSPPWDAALVDKPGLGKVLVGRGAVNTKGPQGAFLAALHAFKSAGRKLPVNIVFVA
jgi:acetylornithine deacetylase/succinyl-diaminopimelate desuccinylase-like protein